MSVLRRLRLRPRPQPPVGGDRSRDDRSRRRTRTLGQRQGITLAYRCIVSILILTAIWLSIRAFYTYVEYGPEWISGKPFNLLREATIPIALIGFPAAIANALGVRFVRQTANQCIQRGSVLYVCMSLVVYLWLIQPLVVKMKGFAGEWLYDAYLRIMAPDESTGPILGNTMYEVALIIQNRSAVDLYIPQVSATFFNDEGAAMLGLPSGKVFETTIYSDLTLQPHDETTITLNDNQILPKNVDVKIFHNLNKEASLFRIKLGGIPLPLSCPPRLDDDRIFVGHDLMESLAVARRLLEKIDKQATLFSAFPANSRQYRDRKTGLRYTEVSTWIINFCGYNDNVLLRFVGNMPDEIVRLSEACVWHDVPFPEIGNQKAVAFANETNDLCAEWTSFKLLAGMMNGQWITAWHLPYRGRDSLPLIIGAQKPSALRVSSQEPPSYQEKGRETHGCSFQPFPSD